jgi:hypothetical protein
MMRRSEAERLERAGDEHVRFNIGRNGRQGDVRFVRHEAGSRRHRRKQDHQVHPLRRQPARAAAALLTTVIGIVGITATSSSAAAATTAAAAFRAHGNVGVSRISVLVTTGCRCRVCR